MNWLLKLGIELTTAAPQLTAELVLPFVSTWAALATAGANPRTWEQLTTQTWQELI